MKKFKLILSIIAVTLVFYTCSKDQKVVKELKGDWTVSSITVNGASDTTDYSQDVYSFSKCKVKKGPCDGSFQTNDPSKGLTTMTFTYSITGDGTLITINMNIPLLGIVSTVNQIVEHSKETFVMSNSDGSDVTVTTLSKK